MIKREEVEALLRAMKEAKAWLDHRGEWGASAGFVKENTHRIEELARTWLAVDGAPEVTVPKLQVHTGLPKERWKPHAIELPRELAGQRVKLVLVPEADSGGDRG